MQFFIHQKQDTCQISTPQNTMLNATSDMTQGQVSEDNNTDTD